MKQQPRKIKIHKKFVSRKYYTTHIPEIRLEGKWLYELGFTEGSTVIIYPEHNKLIITIDAETQCARIPHRAKIMPTLLHQFMRTG